MGVRRGGDAALRVERGCESADGFNGAAVLRPRKRRVESKRRGWSQVELAERLGVSRQTVNAIENERYDPSLPLAFRIGRVFELPIEEVFRYEGE